MSDRLDEQIRELFLEADVAAPEAPLLPAIPKPASSAPRWLVPAAGLVAVLLMVAGLLAVLPRSESGEATGTTSAAATETTEQTAAATTVAAAGTTVAAGTTEAAAGTTTESGASLASVDAACVVFASSSAVVLPRRPETAEQAQIALTELLEPTSGLAAELNAAAVSTGDQDLAELAFEAEETIHQGIIDFVESEPATMETYDQISHALDELGRALDERGAFGCGGLIGALP